MEETTHKITHAIIDMDGLLLDTEKIYREVTNEILETYGKNYTEEDIVQLTGLENKEFNERIVKKKNLAISAKRLGEMRGKKNAKRFHFAKPMPGAMELVENLIKCNIKIALATSSSRENYNIKSSNNQKLFGMFGDNITCGDDKDIKRGKPSPDLFLTSWEKMGKPNLENVLVIEDSFIGIEAARNAGMKAIWVPDPKLREKYEIEFKEELSSLKSAGMLLETLDSLEEFNPAKYHLSSF